MADRGCWSAENQTNGRFKWELLSNAFRGRFKMEGGELVHGDGAWLGGGRGRGRG